MDLTQIAWMAVLTLGNVLIIALKIIEKRNGKNRYNPHPPGEAKMCRENRDIIISTRTKVENMEGDIKEIFKKLDKK